MESYRRYSKKRSILLYKRGLLEHIITRQDQGKSIFKARDTWSGAMERAARGSEERKSWNNKRGPEQQTQLC